MTSLFHLIQWHFRKEMLLVISLILTAIFALMIPWLGLGHQFQSSAVELSVAVYIVLAACLLTRLVHSQPYAGTDSFWRTRPYSRLVYLWSQFLVLVASVALPTFIVFLVHAHWMGGGVSDILGLYSLAFATMSVFFAAAVLTDNVFKTALLSGGSMLVMVGFISFADYCNNAFNLKLNFNTILFSFPLCGILALVISHFPVRRFKIAWGVFLFGGAIVPLCALAFPDFKKHRKMGAELDGVTYSLQETVPEQHQAASYLSHTLIDSHPDDLVTIPMHATIEANNASYFLRYNERLLGERVHSPIIDRIIQSFPSGTKVVSTGPLWSVSDRHPYTSALRTKNGITLGVSEIKIEGDVTGAISSKVYSFSKIILPLLRKGESVSGEGVRVTIRKIQESKNRQDITLLLTELEEEPPMRELEKIYSPVLYSPSSRTAIIGDQQTQRSSGMQSPVIRAGFRTWSFPASDTFTSDADEVELHFFLSQDLTYIHEAKLAVKPGRYYTGNGGNRDTSNLAAIEDFSRFREQFFEYLLRPGYKDAKTLLSSLLSRTGPELEKLILEMDDSGIPVSSLEKAIVQRKLVKKFTISFLLKMAQRDPSFFKVLWSHPERNQAIPLAIEYLKKGETRPTEAALSLAARSDDPEVKPLLVSALKRVPITNDNTYDNLRRVLSHEELEASIVETQRKIGAGLIGMWQIERALSRHGNRDAFRGLVLRLEKKAPEKRVEDKLFGSLQKLLTLSGAQVAMSDEELVLWISKNVERFAYDKSSRSWSVN